MKEEKTRRWAGKGQIITFFLSVYGFIVLFGLDRIEGVMETFRIIVASSLVGLVFYSFFEWISKVVQESFNKMIMYISNIRDIEIIKKEIEILKKEVELLKGDKNGREK